MTCCGGKRAAQRESAASWFIRSKGPEAEHTWIAVTYTGAKALSLTGPVTGARYHFAWRGATLPVDRRDATNLLLRDDLRVHKQSAAER
jgi:hypothetical protein